MKKRTLSIIITLTLLLSVAVLPAQAAYQTQLVGDVNGNNIVEIDDVTFLQRQLAGISIPFEFDETTADADEDGDVNITDVTHLQRWMVNLDQNLNIGKAVYPWFDKSIAKKMDDDSYWGENLEITRICPTHFYATPIIPLPVEYKINGSISDHWCVGDQVFCTFNNVYEDDYDRIEGDLLSIAPSTFVPDPNVCYKPVIYLYPEEDTKVNVTLDLNGEFLTTYPAYDNGWTVTAAPDGTLTDQNDKTYPYLFWEGKLNADYDLSKGFCVKGEDTESFLREKLALLGLKENEIADFTAFWVKLMQNDPYNVISFQTTAYTDAAKLSISPEPDTTIRVFMTYYPSDEAVSIPAQELVTPERTGFTAVEWGGQMIAK